MLAYTKEGLTGGRQRVRALITADKVMVSARRPALDDVREAGASREFLRCEAVMIVVLYTLKYVRRR